MTIIGNLPVRPEILGKMIEEHLTLAMAAQVQLGKRLLK